MDGNFLEGRVPFVDLDLALGLLPLDEHPDRAVRGGVPFLDDLHLLARTAQLVVHDKEVDDRPSRLGDATRPVGRPDPRGDVQTSHNLLDLKVTGVPVTSPNEGLAADRRRGRYGLPHSLLALPSALGIAISAQQLDVASVVGVELHAHDPMGEDDLRASDVETAPPGDCDTSGPAPLFR